MGWFVGIDFMGKRGEVGRVFAFLNSAGVWVVCLALTAGWNGTPGDERDAVFKGEMNGGKGCIQFR